MLLLEDSFAENGEPVVWMANSDAPEISHRIKIAWVFEKNLCFCTRLRMNTQWNTEL